MVIDNRVNIGFTAIPLNRSAKIQQIKIIKRTLTALREQHKIDIYRIERFVAKLKTAESELES